MLDQFAASLFTALPPLALLLLVLWYGRPRRAILNAGPLSLDMRYDDPGTGPATHQRT